MNRSPLSRLEKFAVESLGRPPGEVIEEFARRFTGYGIGGFQLIGHASYDAAARSIRFEIAAHPYLPGGDGWVIVSPHGLQKGRAP